MFQPNQSTFSNSVMDKVIGIDPIQAVQGVGKIVVEVVSQFNTDVGENLTDLLTFELVGGIM